MFRADVICADENQQTCVVGCTSSVSIEAVYRSRVEVQTHDGFGCLLSTALLNPNVTEALAQDEVAFLVNGDVVLQKAVVVQNGTQVQTQVGLELGGEVGQSKQGVSANMAVKFGVSVTRAPGSVGNKPDLLNGRGGKTVSVPMDAFLSSKGKTDVLSRARTSAGAVVFGAHWFVYWVGRSTCPEAGWAADGDRFGYESGDFNSDRDFANEFFRVHGSGLRFH